MSRKHLFSFSNNLIEEIWPYLVIIVLTTIIEWPQIKQGRIILGDDTLFHYNRFYDAAMQIRHHNWQYWISMYGFHHSGRIVNAIYSPYLSYVMGGLLLLCHSFLHFQLLTDYLVPLLAGFCLQVGFRIAEIRTDRDRILIAIYPFVYQIMHWNISTSFTTVGTIVLPLVVGCLVASLRDREEPIIPLQLGGILALVIQLHLVTAYQSLMLCLLILPVSLALNRGKAHFIQQIIDTAIIVVILSLNIVAGALETFSNNHVTPLYALNFKNNRSFSGFSQTFDGQSSSILLLIIVVVLFLLVISVSKGSNRYIGCLSMLFFFLSTDILPWHSMIRATPFIGVIQYPSRFLAPAVVLAFFFIAMTFYDDLLMDVFRRFIGTALCACALLTVSNMYTATKSSENKIELDQSVRPWHLVNGRQVYNNKKIVRAFAGNNLGAALDAAYQLTPDYLPLTKGYTWKQATSRKWSARPASRAYEANDADIYRNQQVLHKQDRVKYYVKGNKMIFTIDNLKKSAQQLIVPVVAYGGTNAAIQGESINTSPSHCDRNINLPQNIFQPGKTTVSVNYQANIADNIMVLISIAAWTILTLIIFFSWLGSEYTRMKLRK